MPSDIPLPGPPASSLLGFLSLLGLLRSLEEAETGWRPRLSWDGMVPRLNLDGQIGRQDVADAAARGIEKFGRRLKFPSANPDVGAEEFALWQGRLDPEAVGAIGSDACVKKGKDAVESTALCMMFGAGRQEFLPRLTLATAVDRENRHGVRKEVHDALFSRWLYRDTVPKIAFRWDPTEFRPHAMQDSDPKKDPGADRQWSQPPSRGGVYRLPVRSDEPRAGDNLVRGRACKAALCPVACMDPAPFACRDTRPDAAAVGV